MLVIWVIIKPIPWKRKSFDFLNSLLLLGQLVCFHCTYSSSVMLMMPRHLYLADAYKFRATEIFMPPPPHTHRHRPPLSPPLPPPLPPHPSTTLHSTPPNSTQPNTLTNPPPTPPHSPHYTTHYTTPTTLQYTTLIYNILHWSTLYTTMLHGTTIMYGDRSMSLHPTVSWFLESPSTSTLAAAPELSRQSRLVKTPQDATNNHNK